VYCQSSTRRAALCLPVWRCSGSLRLMRLTFSSGGTVVDLTVCVISYHRPKLLRDTLASIKAQLHGITSRVVVVDNATTPETRAVIEEAGLEGWAVEEN